MLLEYLLVEELFNGHFELDEVLDEVLDGLIDIKLPEKLLDDINLKLYQMCHALS